MKNKNLETMRHSCSHVLAAAVKKIYGPEVKLGIGPAIEGGFYYDFDFPKDIKISEVDFPKIEKEMKKIVEEGKPFVKHDELVSGALANEKRCGEPYKAELIEDLKKEGVKKVSYYSIGKLGPESKFNDLCLGPHLANTSQIGAFKLLSVAGAYWRGSEVNPMLTRIYGTCFKEQRELSSHLKQLEEAKKRDHRKIGPQLELFLLHKTSPGMPYWLPKGMIIYNELLKFWRQEHQKRGYQEISTPQVIHKDVWEISGHWEHYRDEMFTIPIDKHTIYGLKPMNCPNAMIVFASKLRSYRDLPLRFSDCDVLHRRERSGVLSGLFRVQKFAQDDAHIFIEEGQIEEEYERIFDIADLFYSVFDIQYKFRLSTRPKNAMGSINTWNKAESVLKRILDKRAGKGKYIISAEEGAFYGPKIDILMRDILGRYWQTGTIQLDFLLPKRFMLKYTDKDGKQKTPIVIHRVIYGSLERFIGILIEHYGGAFPVWLAPVQVKIIPIARRHQKYAQEVAEKLEKENLRVEVSDHKGTMEAKIRDGELEKIPYMLVVGDKEIKTKTVAVRARGEKDLGKMALEKFLAKIKSGIENKA